eukprot:scaffold24116_cov166-Cylindrotheca_fusiformis.AAC.1
MHAQNVQKLRRVWGDAVRPDETTGHAQRPGTAVSREHGGVARYKIGYVSQHGKTSPCQLTSFGLEPFSGS